MLSAKKVFFGHVFGTIFYLFKSKRTLFAMFYKSSNQIFIPFLTYRYSEPRSNFTYLLKSSKLVDSVTTSIVQNSLQPFANNIIKIIGQDYKVYKYTI